MSFGARLQYALEGFLQIRPIAKSSFKAAFVILLPESLAGITKTSCACRWRHLSFQLRREDLGTVRQVLAGAEYDFITPLLAGREDPVVLDLGGNIGAFALYTLGLRPPATILSVEASRSNFLALDRNRKANPDSRWSVRHAAVWKESGSVQFAVSDVAATMGQVSAQGGETVPAVRLDNLLNEVGGAADLVKMDIEGAEEAVLGASVDALEKITSLVVQVHPRLVNSERVTKILAASFPNVYEVTGRRSENPLFVATRLSQEMPLELVRVKLGAQ